MGFQINNKLRKEVRQLTVGVPLLKHQVFLRNTIRVCFIFIISSIILIYYPPEQGRDVLQCIEGGTRYTTYF